MSASDEKDDLETLRAMARGRGISDVEQLEHDELVEALRRAGLAEAAAEPGDPRLAEAVHGEPGSGTYHGEGVGRREQTTGVSDDTGE
jgi:hypothetical protein